MASSAPGISPPRRGPPPADPSAPREPLRRGPSGRGEIAVVFAVTFAVLVVVHAPARRGYTPSVVDIPHLVDAFLSRPGASWTDWFVKGHTNLWSPYPEWPLTLTGFMRPTVVALLYVAHLVLGDHWPAYLVLGDGIFAGLAAGMWALARGPLGLGRGAALASTLLAMTSSAMLGGDNWGGPAWFSETLGGLLAMGAFFALRARRDIVGAGLIALALLSKETLLWVPVAAASTVFSRPAPGSTAARVLRCVPQLLPLVGWLALRLSFYRGIGGTYATAQLGSAATYLKHLLLEAAHLPVGLADARPLLHEHAAGHAWMILALMLGLVSSLSGWALIAHVARRRGPGEADDARVVVLWTLVALAFHTLLAQGKDRYGLSAVELAWPLLFYAAHRWATLPARVLLGAAVAGGLTSAAIGLHRGSLLPGIVGPVAPHPLAPGGVDAFAALPARIRTVYVVGAEGLPPAAPDIFRSYYRLPVDAVRLADLRWACTEPGSAVKVDVRRGDGTIELSLESPPCGAFSFAWVGLSSVERRLRRSDSIQYDLPDVEPISVRRPTLASVELGRRLGVTLRPPGPARIVVEHGSPEGTVWFDVD